MSKTVNGFTHEELALAYELRQEGIGWKRIAQGLGCDSADLYAAVKHCRQYGLINRKQIVTAGQLQAAINMRENSRISWRSIAEHLDMSLVSIRSAYYRHMEKLESVK